MSRGMCEILTEIEKRMFVTSATLNRGEPKAKVQSEQKSPQSSISERLPKLFGFYQECLPFIVTFQSVVE